MRLETERLVLRMPGLEDADGILEMVADDEVIAPDNLRSVRVAEKLGAHLEEQVGTDHGPAGVWVHAR